MTFTQPNWNPWLNFAQGSANGEPWTELLKTWGTALSGGAAAGPMADLTQFQQSFTKAGETYLNMLQQFYQATGQAKPLDQAAEEWLQTMQKSFSGAFTNGKDPLAALDPFNFLASFPGIGYTREKQEKLSHLYQQWTDYEAKSREYTISMAKVGLEAIEKFRDYVVNPPAGAKPLTSLKEVYGKWVDVCEDIYAKYAMTDEYTALYGAVVNALMEFKKKQNELLDDALDQFGMPTRTEVDSLHERLHALRREVHALKAELKGAAKSTPAAPKPAAPAAAPKKGKKK